MKNEQFTEQEREYIYSTDNQANSTLYLSERKDCDFPDYLINLKVNNLPIGNYRLNLFHGEELVRVNANNLNELDIPAKASQTLLRFSIEKANTSFTLIIKGPYSRNIITELRKQEVLNKHLQNGQGLNV